jgi:hypothetical protein
LLGEDVFKAGIASHYIPSERIAELEEKIAGTHSIAYHKQY